MPLLSPKELKNNFPLAQEDCAFISKSRTSAKNIITKKEQRIALLVGPCSIHNLDAALEYGQKLYALSKQLKTIFPIMRVFLEKPRTSTGWRGILYDPHLDHSHRIEDGLALSRKILLKLTEMQVPCATELLDPITVPYFEDLITWGIVGARTTSSPLHRLLASQLNFPVGFKNDLHGSIDTAIHSIICARLSHQRIGINEEGSVDTFLTQGNPWTHLVLRGSHLAPNYDEAHVSQAICAMNANHIPSIICIDCSHGNSHKNHTLQRIAFQSAVQQRLTKNMNLVAIMLESHLFEGKQPLKKEKPLNYGVSITDACIGWKETESLILWAEEMLSGANINESCPKMMLPRFY